MGAEEDRRPLLGAPGQPAEDVAHRRADRRAGVVLVPGEPEPVELARAPDRRPHAPRPAGSGSRRARGSRPEERRSVSAASTATAARGPRPLERRADEPAEQRGRPRRSRLELRVELARDEPRVIGQLDDLDEPPLLERSGDDETGVDELVAELVVDLVAVPVALVDRRLAVDLARARPSRRARRPARRAASCRRDPRSPSAPAGGRSPGYGVSGSISVELAPSRPHTCRANSETATCMPRQIPRYGMPCSRATRQARILPSQPREPKPPGTSTPSARLELLDRLLVGHVLGVEPAHVSPSLPGACRRA